MRKMVLAVVALCIMAGIVLAQSNEVTSVNVVGYNRVTMSPGKYYLLALQFDGLDATNQTFQGVFGTNVLRGGSNPNTTDQLWLWDVASQKYTKYFMKTDGKYYYVTNSSILVNPPIEAGDVVWVKTPSSLATNTIALMGQVVDVMTQAVDLVKNYNLKGYGFSSDTRVGDLNISQAVGAKANANANLADQIFLWDSDGQKYLKLFLKTNGWYYVTNSTISAANLTIKLGDGFWYLGRTNFVWTETNKYIGNL